MIRVLELPDGSHHDNGGTEVWSGQTGVDRLARAVIRCFDEVARTYGESGYRGKWGSTSPEPSSKPSGGSGTLVNGPKTHELDISLDLSQRR